MSLKETNRLRLGRLLERFDARRAPASASAEARAAFEAAFALVRDGVLEPLFEDVGRELRSSGHDYLVERDAHPKTPSVALRVLLRGGDPLHANAIVFFVRHDGGSPTSEVIVELTLRHEFELGRFRDVAAMSRAALEQMVVDGVEHLIVCNP